MTGRCKPATGSHHPLGRSFGFDRQVVQSLTRMAELLKSPGKFDAAEFSLTTDEGRTLIGSSRKDSMFWQQEGIYANSTSNSSSDTCLHEDMSHLLT